MQSTQNPFDFDGLQRQYLLLRPERPDGSLIIGLHGATQRGSIMAHVARFHDLPEAAHFTLLYPDAWEGIWRDGRADDDEIDDIGFIEALLEMAISDLAIDPQRIFLVGASNGGFLSQRLICDLPGFFQAVATVIATMGLNVFQRSYIDEIPSLYLIAGSGDPIIPFAGGSAPGSLMANENAPILSFDDLVDHWKTVGSYLDCRQTRFSVAAIGAETLTIKREICHANQRPGRQLQAITVEGGGHQWYGRAVSAGTVSQFGATTTEFQVSADIIAFFNSLGVCRT